MSTNSEIAKTLKRIEEKDPELYAELNRKRIRGESMHVNQFNIVLDKNLLGDFHESMPPADQLKIVLPERSDETIVLGQARPVLVIRDNQIVPEFVGPDSLVWKDRLMQQEGILNMVIPSVGKIEVSNNAIYQWVGTGWLIDKDIIITNRHVASIFCQNKKEGFIFKIGYPSGQQTANIDFLEEDQRYNSLDFDVDSVLWIAPNDVQQPDVAFMRIKPRNKTDRLPAVMKLSDSINDGEIVVTIGYPARDPDFPDQELVLRVFGNVYDKKRLSPGEITKVGDTELEHDCSTFGGSSGSPVISLASGEVVGLHFAGLYGRANYAVPSTVLSDLLKKLKSGQLTEQKNSENINTEIKKTSSNQKSIIMQSSQKYSFEINIPIKVTVELGQLITDSNQPTPTSFDNGGKKETDINNLEAAVAIAQKSLVGQEGVIDVRSGYRFRRGWITNEKVIVVEVQEKQTFPKLKEAGKLLIPQEISGFGVDVRTAGINEQLQFLGLDLFTLEAAPRPGVYKEPPTLELSRVKTKMDAIFHVSPDAGWQNLKNFFARIEKHLTATIYEWEAQHISDSLFEAINNDGRKLKMVTQKKGTEEAVSAMKGKLGDKFEHIWASVGSGKIVPSAYHIKVASRDEEEVWLSSGNWKDSNQPDISPADDHSTTITPLRKHNREWHVIIKNKELSKLFQEYINWDFEEASRVPLEEAPFEQEIYLFIPESAYTIETERPGLGKYFEPLIITEKELDIQPLLTPDRDSRGRRFFIQQATQLIETAQKSIDIENQSFALLKEDNDPQYEQFFNVLLRKQQQGVTVRIIFRDPREFSYGAKGEKALQTQLERLKDLGFDTDNIRVQEKCHTKGIIVDSEIDGTAAVMFGSHNLTTSGALYNRDASLIIKDREVAQYFQQIFNFDWEVLSKQSAEESVAGIRIAKAGEATPEGYRKVALSDIRSMD